MKWIWCQIRILPWFVILYIGILPNCVCVLPSSLKFFKLILWDLNTSTQNCYRYRGFPWILLILSEHVRAMGSTSHWGFILLYEERLFELVVYSFAWTFCMSHWLLVDKKRVWRCGFYSLIQVHCVMKDECVESGSILAFCPNF